MTIQLNKNDAVRLIINKNRRENARVKEWIDSGCVCFAFSGAIALRPGTKVQVEIPNSDPQAFYYMQAVEALDAERTELHLSRNLNSQFDHRRRSWRVPYLAKTVIRRKDSPQFINAEFSNVSMEAAYLMAEEKFPVNAEVELRLVLPEYPEHTVLARVMRSSETALDKNAAGKDRYGVLVRFSKLPKIVMRHLTYFMWQQIRKTHLRQLQVVFAGSAKKTRKPAEAGTQPEKIVAAVAKRPQNLD
ncbi:MAG TPA: PilZ domain-containing protein [Candidatus Hydrogenedentes bacterium]|nr:PilZ domain-containing protein [Candidatus Hydrogenedentota bacterium]